MLNRSGVLTLESTPAFTIEDMNIHIRQIVASGLFAAFTGSAMLAQHPEMPPGMTHEEHLAQMERDGELKTQGAAAMGFDQDRTTHHFRLDEAGGAIEVGARDAADEGTVSQVRTHLREIAGQFTGGDFGKPFATHGEMPPGVSMMQRRKDAFTFRYEEMATGGRVRIAASDAAATGAIHEFLRYQIREHGTGDPLTVAR
jgi:hypothetical protein